MITPQPTSNNILVTLQLMTTVPPCFHWAIFVGDPSCSTPCSGIKFHAITVGQQTETGWSYDKTGFRIDTVDFGVVVAVVIGNLKGKSVDDIDNVLKNIPMQVPAIDVEKEPRFSCRVWCREALRRLDKEGIISCSDINAMEKEVWEYGEAAADILENHKEDWKGPSLVTAHNSK
ncbi:uncharacterized protein EV420DRAFT_1503546 [Desarmillaria tabescens]|uniref:Uncharacterized protein n=1 Tax=Armillaria tabescens TaxID=1929756 RepID=A0AA39NMB5_ARMTA|nr:uncharacterized protein EV420DRAFT_1503546 [Desarmillaria tabescens]KAK0468261.1 hypothetical protein EV420DRAFT_1503546 [Desarmillaria tabescens]